MIRTAALALTYLGAIVAANLTIAALGKLAVIPVGLVLIGLDLVARDQLHDRWTGRRLVLGMAALIALGGALSYALNAGAGRVALASCVAFTVAAVLDAVTYGLLGRAPVSRFGRSAGSNLPAAAADSFLFLAIAFPGPAPLVLVAWQFAAKALGGAAWAAVLYRPARELEDGVITANPDLGPAGARSYR